MDDNTKETLTNVGATAFGCTVMPLIALLHLVFFVGGGLAVLSFIFWLIGLIFGHHAPPE